MEKSVINWGYNCLTSGVHHGRPEAIWNLPLRYAVDIYGIHALEEIVVARIFTDAMQYVTDGIGDRPSEEWAEKVRDLSEEKFRTVLGSKIDDLSKYYRSNIFHSEVRGVIERLERDKLNPGYAPLHHHDTINMLCRILGVSCSIEAAKS